MSSIQDRFDNLKNGRKSASSETVSVSSKEKVSSLSVDERFERLKNRKAVVRNVPYSAKGNEQQKTTGGATPSVEELYAQDYAKAQKKQREAGDIMAFGAGGGNMNDSHFGNFFSAGVTGSAAGYANAVGTAAAAVGENDRKEVERWQRSLAAAKDALAKAETPADRTKAQAWADEAEKNLAAMQKQQAEVTKAEKAAEKVEKGAYWAADKLQEKSQEYTDRGNEGLGKVGRVLGSAVVSGTQMLGDAGLNALIPGTGLAAMGVRAFGGSAQEARKDGASYEQQLMYGGANAAVEVLSEKMFNGLSGLYGKGFMDESKLAKGVSKAFARMDNTAAGRTAKAVLGNMGEEAMEEVVAGVIEPAFGSLYNGKKIRENYDSDTVADIVEAAVVGGLLGGLGGSAEIANNAYETKAYQGVYGTDTEALVKEALDINPESKTAQKAQEKLKKGKQLSAAEIRRLVQENEQAMQQGAENTQGAMERQETEQPEEQIAENTRAMAQNAAMTGAGQTAQNPERMRRGIAYQEENAQEEPLKEETRQPTVEELYARDYEAARERMEAPQREAEAQEMESYAAAYPGMERIFTESKPADLSAREWNAAWNVAYQTGASTTEEAAETNLQKVQSRLQGIVRPEIAEVAFHAGRESASNERSMSNEEIIGDQSGVRDGGQWAGGTNSAEQIREVEEDAGRAAEKAAERGAESLTGRAVRRGDMPEGVQVKSGTQMVEGEKTESMKRGEAIARKNGLTVRWFRGDNIILPGGGEVNGCYDGKEVWARADDLRFTAEQIVRHEVTHDEIQRGLVDTEKVWTELERKYGEDRMAGYLEMYREAFMGADFTDEEVMEEIICDAEGGMNKFAGVLDSVAGEYGEVLEAAKQETEQSRKTQRGPPESAKNTATEGGVKGSLMGFNDGTRFVEVNTDQEIFDGLTIKEQQALAKRIIHDKFAGKVIGIDNKAFVNGSTAKEFTHPAKNIKDELVREAKMRASPELDNLLDAGSNFRTAADGADGHIHKNAVGDFIYFDTIFRVNGEFYKGTINIQQVKNGKLLKDITKIENITQDITNSYGKNPKFGFLRDASIDSIPASSEKSNRKIKGSAVGRKAEQLAAIQNSNPADDNYHTWIRSESDILTLQEAIEDSDWDYDEYNPDWTREMAREAIESGKVTVYSSYPIETGGFISPSKMEAESYSGDGKVYSKRVAVDDVAWIDPTQGQYAPVAKVKGSSVAKDSEYMELAKEPEKNRDKLQKMVSEAAKAAGYDSPMLYHGTTKFGFTEIDTGKSADRISFFTTTSADMAQTYSSTEGVRQIGNKNGAVPTTTQEILDAIRHSNLYKTGNVEYFDNTSDADEFVMKKIERTMKMAERRMDEKHFMEFWAAADLWMTKQTEQNRMRLEQATLKAEYALRDKPSIMRDLMENATKMFEIYDCLAENQPVFWYGNEAHLTDEAQVEASRISDTAGNYSFYGRTDNLLQIDANGKNWNHIPVDLMALERYDAKDDGTGHYFTNTRDLAKYAKNNGYSGVKIMNVVDNGGRGTKTGAGDIYIYVGDQASQQLKSADTVTYDEDGEIIPLSKRFSDSKDIRFSSTGKEEVKALEAQNNALQAQVKALNREKAKLTEQVNKYRDKATFSPERVGREIIKAYNGTVKEAEIHEEVRQLIDYAARKDGISYGRLKEMAVGVAGKIVRSAESVANSEVQQEYRDIREYHKQVKIRVSEQVKRDFWDWNGWQKLNGRKLNVRNGEGVPIDVAYAEMQERFGTAYYPENIVNPADQLRHMSEVLESLAPVMENPYSYNMAVATESCANELADMVMQEVAKGYAGTISYQQNEKLYSASKTAREQARKAVEAERERWEKQVEDLKLGWRVTEESRRERQADSEARDKLFRMVKRLNNRKLPAATKALLNKYIGDLDTISRGMTGQTINDLSALKHWYEEQSRNNPDFIPDERTKRALERLEKRQVSNLTSKEVAELTQVLQNIEHQIRTEKQFIESQEKRDTHAAGVRAMEDVENSEGGNFTVWEKKFVNETLTPMRQFRRITGYAQNDPLVTMLQEMEAGQRKKIDYAMTNKERFQRWTDDKKLMKRLFGKDADEIEIAGIAKADAKKMAETEGTGEWEKSITRVKITPAMRMSLFLHSLSNDNLRHIAGGGITVPDMKLYKQGKIAEAYSRGTTITLTPSQVRAITARMTPAERAFAFAARDYFNEVSKEAINETSEKLVGYSIAGVDNYYPITTDPNFSKKELDALKYDGTIEGMGFLKERIESKSPMMLQDMNQVLMRSIDNHAKYVGMAIPVRNMSKLLNITEKSFDAAGNPVGAPGSLMATISQKWGGEGLKYVTKVLADEQGGYKETDTWGETLAKLSSNYAGAVLHLNAGAAIKQAASYPTAAAVVGWQPLLKAMRRPGGINTNLIRAYTPLLAYRAEGFSTPEQGGLKEQGKQMPKALNWIQAMDVGTTTLLWRAAEIYVEDNYNLEKGQNIMEGKSPFYQKVAEVYNRIIEETQPNYTTLQRSQLQRSNNQTSKLLNMFKTQPFQNFNILYDAVGDFKAQRRAFTNEGTPEAKARMEEAGKRLKNAVTSQMVAAFVFSMMQWAWDSLRRKDDKYRDKDGEETLLSWMKGMGMNMVSNSVGMIPFGTELWTLFGKSVDTVIKEAGGKPFFGENWYGFEMSVLDTLTDVGSGAVKEVGAVVKVVRQMTSADEETDWESFARETYAAAEDVSVALGIPVGNAKKMLTAAAQWTMVLTHGKWVGNYYALRIEQNPADSRAAFYDLLYRAYKSGDSKQYKELYDIMADNDDFATSSQTPEEAIKSAMESRMKKAEGVSSVKELKQRYKAP